MKLLLTFHSYVLFFLFPLCLCASNRMPQLTITCPADITIDNDKFVCESSSVDLGTAITGNDPGEVVTNDAPSVFPLGVTMVTWTVTDGTDTETCMQSVLVEDNEPPRVPYRIAWDDLNTVSNITDPTLNTSYGVKMMVDGDFAVVAAGQGATGGSAFILERDNAGVWTEEDEIKGSAVVVNSSYGKSVDISGDYAIVGGSAHNTDQYGEGIAYIFERNGSGNWIEAAELLASDRANRDWFGCAVAIDGDFALVGAFGEDGFGSSSGAVYAFERDGTGVWSEVQKFCSNDCSSGDIFGNQILMSGDTAIISAEREDVIVQNEGAVYVFVKDGTGTWSQVQKVTYSGADPNDAVGSQMAMHGNFLVLGREYHDVDTDNVGSAVVYKKDVNGDYQEEELLVAPDGNYKDFLGGSGIAINEDFIAMGSRDVTAHYNSGAVYIYELQDDDSWTINDKIRPTNTNHHIFGGSVAFHDSGQLLVGAPSFASSANFEDAVYYINNATATDVTDTYVACGGSVVAPMVIDNCAGMVTGTTTNALLTDVIGNYVVSWSFDDGNGNTANYDQQVTVYDGVAPTLTCMDVTVNVDPNGNFFLGESDLGITYSDECSSVNVLTSPNILIDCNDIGVQNYITQVEDDAENRSECYGSITVLNASETVTNLNNTGTGSLRDLINDGCAGDTIYFDQSLEGGTITLSSEIDITKSKVVVGLGENDLTIDGDDTYRIFHTTADDLDVYLSGMKLINGYDAAQGGAILNEGNLYLSDMIFINNKEVTDLKAWTNLKNIEIKTGTVDIRN